METNINTQDVGSNKPSLFGMITCPGGQVERMKTKGPVWGAVGLFIFMGTIMTTGAAYLTLNNTPELAKELNGEAGAVVNGSTLGGGTMYGV